MSDTFSIYVNALGMLISVISSMNKCICLRRVWGGRDTRILVSQYLLESDTLIVCVCVAHYRVTKYMILWVSFVLPLDNRKSVFSNHDLGHTV